MSVRDEEELKRKKEEERKERQLNEIMIKREMERK